MLSKGDVTERNGTRVMSNVLGARAVHFPFSRSLNKRSAREIGSVVRGTEVRTAENERIANAE